jgi:glycine cleavage system regulatory protein
VNSSDGRSDYYIEASVEDSSGAKVGTANTLVTGVDGEQTAKDELTGTFSGKGKDLTVRLTEVQRTAS